MDTSGLPGTKAACTKQCEGKTYNDVALSVVCEEDHASLNCCLYTVLFWS
jgi:hypothetical protein